ncbi:response regulator transcription factor [Flavobacterium sp.]|jgi:DNA-binding LytR/AlgR family response regulator|uniref:LytR/AlgR family response regulator transcription factor n=1 Tax=Flavobacterium sp. TaxID=239 RepID=UPI002A820E3C|nr:response regulator transcription factor [Flavobacterium sp.]
MPIKLLIVEDEIFIADYIQEILEEANFTNIQQANSPEEAIKKLYAFQPDIVLMDINLAGQNEGITLSQNEFKEQQIIFLTAQNDQVTINKALQGNPHSYLTKPIKELDLVVSIQLLAAKLKTNTITIKDSFDLVRLNLEDILFIKSDNNYIDIQTTTSKYSIRNSLDGFLKELNNSNFVRVHRSFVLNKTKVTKKTSTLLFIENYEIPSSRNYDFQL